MSLEGVWYNELGSRIDLEVDGCSIEGTYQTAVGAAEGAYRLVGRTDGQHTGTSQAVGFVVSWVNEVNGNSFSVTAWSGQCQATNGEELLVMQWLLTTETNPDDDWVSTLVGHDTFRRTPPSEEEMTRRWKRGPQPHPGRLHR